MSIRIEQCVVLNILKHFRNTHSSFNNQTHCGGRMYGVVNDESIVEVTGSTPKSGEGKLKMAKDIVGQNCYCVGMYVCGGSKDLTEQQLEYLTKVKENIGSSFVVYINPTESLKRNSLVMEGYVLENESTKELKRVNIVLYTSSLQKNFIAQME
ncbi:hypothetical protein EDI_094090 [Entamoeba dispar SAW760]|uniref:Uncharacterized protein n=1 Tax=Entamoeba dispar (strain ATCC PRA-260 / SAW760) TaxID=370354 RepID=B0E6M9_ENTDS|nr:uncharacterized protein EDI_094090 [Entamoeba dispar SAW760]EDR29810.1 hypothetical protein EDI_094090 [Entamoeba dispar SAW760]|eukprot:EDR29810.1 hypothetical protein EDI_094090 [Entamoeba dispar SAW760]